MRPTDVRIRFRFVVISGAILVLSRLNCPHPWPTLRGMERTDSLDELLICRLDAVRKSIEPCSIIIFGASGDLTARKLIPALYQLYIEKQLPNPFRIIGFARREKTDESWRAEMGDALHKFSRTKEIDDAQWQGFASNLFYCRGEFGDEK